MIFEILVGRNTPSIRETFAEIFGTLRQMGYVPHPYPNMARKYGIFNFSAKKFEFGPKITELWAKNACPYMGARTIFDHNSALK